MPPTICTKLYHSLVCNGCIDSPAMLISFTNIASITTVKPLWWCHSYNSTSCKQLEPNHSLPLKISSQLPKHKAKPFQTHTCIIIWNQSNKQSFHVTPQRYMLHAVISSLPNHIHVISHHLFKTGTTPQSHHAKVRLTELFRNNFGSL